MRELKIRIPTYRDAMVLGMLLQSSLDDAPSSTLEAEELHEDCEEVGRAFVSSMLFGDDSLLVADFLGRLLGIARLYPHEFARASHVATLQLLVSPNARRRGVGRCLLAAALEEAFQVRGYERVEIGVSTLDDGLEQLLAQTPVAWTLERVERAALHINGKDHDLGRWVTDSQAWKASKGKV